MTISNGQSVLLMDASIENPALVTIQNNGAAGTPTLYVGEDQTGVLSDARETVARVSLSIAPGGASPQLTITAPLFGAIDATGGTTQSVVVNKQRLTQ